MPDDRTGSSNPLQVGAALFGHAGTESDAEVPCLLIEILELADYDRITVVLGHQGIFKALVRAAGLAGAAGARILDCLPRKAQAELIQVIGATGVPQRFADLLLSLLRLNGGTEVVAQGAAALREAPATVTAALGAPGALLDRLHAEVAIHVDLAEPRGYAYHTGVVFAA